MSQKEDLVLVGEMIHEAHTTGLSAVACEAAVRLFATNYGICRAYLTLDMQLFRAEGRRRFPRKCPVCQTKVEEIFRPFMGLVS